MAGHRAQWKGFIKFGEVSCGVGLYTAASTSERISFHTINKKTGNRVNRIFIDSDTGKEVECEDQTKGFEIENGQYLMIDPEEVAATIPDSNKTLTVEAFIPCSGVDDVYFDKPHYLVPTDRMSSDAFTALRDAMEKSQPVKNEDEMKGYGLRSGTGRSPRHDCQKEEGVETVAEGQGQG